MTILGCLIFIFWISVIFCQSSDTSSMFVTYRSEIRNTTTSSTPAIGWNNYTINWDISITNIVASHVVLIGHKMQASDFGIGFYAGWTTNQTQGILRFQLYASSSIVYAAFCVIIMRSSKVQIEFGSSYYYSTAIRSSALTPLNVSTSSLGPFTRESDYVVKYFLQSYYFQIPIYNTSAYQDLEIFVNQLIAGSSLVHSFFESGLNSGTKFLEVYMIYIIISLSSLEDASHIYTNRIIYTPSWSNFQANAGAPSLYFDSTSSSCAYGLVKFKETSVHYRPINFDIIYSNPLVRSSITGLISVNYLQINYNILCLTACDQYHYADNGKCLLCFPYLHNCNECLNKQVCTKCAANSYLSTQTKTCVCKVGFNVLGGDGCSNIVGCSEILSNETCITCEVNFDLIIGLCYCKPGYHLASWHCTNVVGCTGAVKEGSTIVCRLCDISQNQTLLGQTCKCQDGFYMTATGKCIQRCGDGFLFNLNCDDGNTEDGDGCSSSCSVERNYACSGGSSIHRSVCIYTGDNLSLSLVSLSKVYDENQGLFKFAIEPALIILKNMNYTTYLQFNCDQKHDVVAINYKNGTITLLINYLQDLETHSANITLSFDTNIALHHPIFHNFSMVSNNFQLLFSNNLNKIRIIGYTMIGFGVIVFAIFLVGSLLHKMIGVETLHCFHIIYLTHYLSNLTMGFQRIDSLTVSTGNFRFISNQATSIFNPKSGLLFESQNKEEATIIFIALSFSALLTFFLTVLLSKVTKIKNKTIIITEISKKMSLISKKVYNSLLFSLFIGFILINSINLTAKIDGKTLPLFRELNPAFQSMLRLILITVTSMVFFYEWKYLLSWKKYSIMCMDKCRNKYISAYLTFILLLNIAFVAGYNQFISFSQEAVLSIVGCFLVWMIYQRPYESQLHNGAQIFNLLIVFIFSIWATVRKYSKNIQEQEFQILLVFIFMVLMATSIVLASIRIISEIRLLIKQPFNIFLAQNVEDDKENLKRQLIDRAEIKKLINNFNPYSAFTIKGKAVLDQLNQFQDQRIANDGWFVYQGKQVRQKIDKIGRYMGKKMQITMKDEETMLKKIKDVRQKYRKKFKYQRKPIDELLNYQNINT